MGSDGIRGALAMFIISLDHLLMVLVAGEDLRVRQAIARTVTRTHPAHRLNSKTRRSARLDLATHRRVE